MWYLEKDFTFEASHQLPNHNGKCARLHGHSWRLTVLVASPELRTGGPQDGMVVDFYKISQPVKKLLEDTLDHYHLNAQTGLANPTSEELARWIYEQLLGKIPHMVGIRIGETCTSRCTYAPKDKILELFPEVIVTDLIDE